MPEGLPSTNPNLTLRSPVIKTFLQNVALDLEVPALPDPKDIFSFGDSNARVTNELNELAFQGIKRATTSYPVPKPLTWGVNDLSIGLDGNGEPAFIMRTTELTICDFEDVTEDFAREEGEEGGGLQEWRDIHRAWYGRQDAEFGIGKGKQVLCEKFEILWPLGIKEKAEQERQKSRGSNE